MKQLSLLYIESVDGHLNTYLRQLIKDGYRIVIITPTTFTHVERTTVGKVLKVMEAIIIVEK